MGDNPGPGFPGSWCLFGIWSGLGGKMSCVPKTVVACSSHRPLRNVPEMPELKIKPSPCTALLQGNLTSFPAVQPGWHSTSWMLRCHPWMGTTLVLNPSHTPAVVVLSGYAGELHSNCSFTSQPTRKRERKYDEKSSRAEVEEEVTRQILLWAPIIITGKTDLS